MAWHALVHYDDSDKLSDYEELKSKDTLAIIENYENNLHFDIINVDTVADSQMLQVIDEVCLRLRVH